MEKEDKNKKIKKKDKKKSVEKKDKNIKKEDKNVEQEVRNLAREAFFSYEKETYKLTKGGPKIVEKERATFVDKQRSAKQRFKDNLAKFEKLSQKETASMVHVKTNHFLGR